MWFYVQQWWFFLDNLLENNPFPKNILKINFIFCKNFLNYSGDWKITKDWIQSSWKSLRNFLWKNRVNIALPTWYGLSCRILASKWWGLQPLLILSRRFFGNQDFNFLFFRVKFVHYLLWKGKFRKAFDKKWPRTNTDHIRVHRIFFLKFQEL